jgi:membrane-associated phospholipid phosphatase
MAVALFVVLGTSTAPKVAWAQTADGDGAIEGAGVRTWSLVLGLGGAYTLAEYIFKPELAPSRCRICGGDVNGFDTAVRDALLWDDVGTARRISDVNLFAQPALTLALLGLASARADRFEQWDDDAGIVLEGAVIAMTLNQLVKFAVGRERPFVAALPPDQKGTSRNPADENLSFFSGHTTWTTALAVGAGIVAHRRNYSLEPWIWASGLSVAAATGYLRIAGDKHYASDVLVGAVVGAAMGYLVPTLLHDADEADAGPQAASSGPGHATVSGGPMPGGAQLSLAFVW